MNWGRELLSILSISMACVGVFQKHAYLITFAIFILVWDTWYSIFLEARRLARPCDHDNHLHTDEGCTVAGCGCAKPRKVT